MKQAFFFILVFFYATSSFSQSLDVANFWFDKYEYQKAVASFEQIPLREKLKKEDYLRWCYAAFTSKNYNTSFKISDSLINKEEVPAFFYYANAFSAMALNKYQIASERFKLYKQKDNEFQVDSLIASSMQIPTWQPEKYVKFIPFEKNTKKANSTGAYSKGTIIFFNESGIDYQRNLVADSVLENAELMFMKPFVYSLNSKTAKKIVFPDELKENNIVSLAIDSTINEVYFTMSNPLSKDIVMKAPHIYVGTFINDTLSNIHIWDYSGIDDSSSTAYATLSPNRNYMVFSKQFSNQETSDLYMSKKNGGAWSTPFKINELSTNGNDGFPLFIDDTTLSFASDGRVGYGGLDVYLSTFKNETFSLIRHIKAPVNSTADDFNLSFSVKRDTVFFTSNRLGAFDDDDVYIIQLKEKEKNKFEEDTLRPQIACEDIIVYFDFDKFNIKPSEMQKINLFDFSCIQNVDYTIYLEGHCDSRGTNNYNDILGYNRAIAVKKQLIKQGIAENKISISSKGKRESLVKCVKCTLIEYGKNRAVIIKIIPLIQTKSEIK